MPDREKVISGLEEIANDKWMKIHADWYVSVCSDAIALIKEQDDEIYALRVELASANELAEGYAELLKEQEAVEPTLIREGRNKYYNDYVCPRCDNVVVYEQNYCSECGIPFLWEGR